MLKLELVRTGNSLGVRIPAPLVEMLDMREGSVFAATLEGGSLVLTPLKLKLVARRQRKVRDAPPA